MKAAGITLSTVGAGGGSNPFLESLATKGGGRFYSADNPASIPDIFLKETQQVSGQQIVEEPFFPILTSSSPILRGLDDGLPRLLGYNGTTAKAAAQTVLVTTRDDPLLAQWQYGLGRSVAWTSDSTGRWAKNWLAWPDFARFFSQLVSWTFPGEETDGIEATFDDVGGRTTLHVESVESDGSRARLLLDTAVVVGPGLEPVDVDLVQVAPGVYEAPLGEVEPGAYAVRVTQIKPGTSPLGSDDRARGADLGRVPAARGERAVPGGPARRDGRRRGPGARRPVDPEPHRDQPVHGPVAAAAHPGAAPVAARHRPAAGVGGSARVRRGRCLGDERRRASGPGGARTATNTSLLAARDRSGLGHAIRDARRCRRRPAAGAAAGRDRARARRDRPAAWAPPPAGTRRHQPAADAAPPHPHRRPRRPSGPSTPEPRPTPWPACERPSAGPANADRAQIDRDAPAAGPGRR